MSPRWGWTSQGTHVSDEQNDNADESSGSGIFDLFEPPPEVDPNRFGPIPVVPTDGAPPVEASDDEVEIDLDDASSTPEGDDVGELSAGDASISSVFGFDPIDEPSTGEDSPAADDVALVIDDLDGEGPLDDASSGPAMDVVSDEDGESALPHWTAPATGLVPKVISGDRDPADGWSEVSGPRWHGEGPQWAGDDLDAVFADEQGVGGPRRVTIDDDELPDLPGAAGSPQRVESAAARAAQRPMVEVDSGRNIGQAIGVGVAFAVIAGGAFWLGKVTTIALITVVAALAAIELFGAMRKAGLHPATLLGIVASGALPLAAYHRADAGFTLVIALSVMSCALWYLSGADTQRPALNIGLTMLGITWIGGLAAFAAFIVQSLGGVEVLLAAVIITVASDTGAFAGGKALGHTPFHSASPNKTWEGTIVGIIASVVAGLVVGILGISVFSDSLTDAVLLGLTVGVLAPIGDLTESLVKRDLGVKDMGTLLPGHGGLLDRVDGLLFVLPGTYYLGNVLGLL